MKLIQLTIFPLLAAFLLVGCSPAVSTTTEATSDEVVEAANEGDTTVEIKLFNFPDVVEVPVGSTVTWLNQDGTQHSVTNGTPEQDGQPEELGGVFDSGFFVQGESFSFTFTEPGEYPYFCMRHNHMQGIIRVVP